VIQQRTIIVGYDGRPAADDAVALAAQLAEFTQATLVLVFAYGTRATDGYRILRRGLTPLPYGFPARVRAIPAAHAWPVLADLAGEMRADLIAIGSTERSPADYLGVGGVAQRLLECAPCPVAVAPMGFRERSATSLKRIGVCLDGSEESAAAFDMASALARSAKAEVRIYHDECVVEDDLQLLLVGWSEGLVRIAPCPVLIVPHSATAEGRLAASGGA
jgi:nucleotide-binding universal stress UspA family protein